MKYNAPRLKYFFFVNKNSRVQNNKQTKKLVWKKKWFVCIVVCTFCTFTVVFDKLLSKIE